MDVYTVTIQPQKGAVQTVAFVGRDRGQVLYAVMELYPDCHVVRICRDGQWDESADRAAADAGAVR